jgi:hypothetical protein
MSTAAEQQQSPEERAEAELAAKLADARNYTITFAAEMFGKRGWRVRVTADWTPAGALVIRAVPSNIDGCMVVAELLRDELLAVDQAGARQAIEALPEELVAQLLGSDACHLIRVPQ